MGFGASVPDLEQFYGSPSSRKKHDGSPSFRRNL